MKCVRDEPWTRLGRPPTLAQLLEVSLRNVRITFDGTPVRRPEPEVSQQKISYTENLTDPSPAGSHPVRGIRGSRPQVAMAPGSFCGRLWALSRAADITQTYRRAAHRALGASLLT